MARRFRLEIMAEILGLCRRPQARTRLVYRTNLSWQMLQEFLSELQSQGLLEVHHSPAKCVTTRKGLRFIEKWRELVELLHPDACAKGGLGFSEMYDEKKRPP